MQIKKNRGYLAFIILILIIQTWARGPKQGTLISEVYGGMALHESGIIDQEKKFVNDYNYYITQYDMWGFLIDSTKLTYDFYRSFFAGLTLDYMIKTRFSLGIAYQYKSISQNPDTYYRSQNLTTDRIVRMDLLAPSLSYWFILKKINFAIKSSLMLGKGKLTRIPTIYSLTTAYETEEEQQFVADYHDPVPLNAIGFALQPAAYFIFRSGFLIKLNVKYEYLSVAVEDTKFDYPSRINFHEFAIELGFGYAFFPKN
jgi:hypothetical protein